MELSILHGIQALHNPVLDQIMVTVFNTLVGSLGQLWIHSRSDFAGDP